VARRGRKRQLDVESRYWQLLLSGVGTVEARRRRKTGYRWRAGSGGVPPVRLAEAVRSNRYLSRLERQRIATLRGQGLGVREIARRDRSITVDTEPGAAAEPARPRQRPLRRRTRARPGPAASGTATPPRIAGDQQLRDAVQAKLEMEWSPEQIAAYRRGAFPDQPGWHVCHETIYQALYWGTSGLSRELTHRQRTGRPLRKRRRRSNQRQVRFIAPAVLIEHWPEVVDRRAPWGTGKGDLLIGRASRSAIGTLVDRVSSVRASDPPAGRAQRLSVSTSPSASSSKIYPRQCGGRSPGIRARRWRITICSLTGSARACSSPTRPARGSGPTNENTNGLLRQYFPKGTNLAVHDAADLRAVDDRLNHRPRKILNWSTQVEIFARALHHEPATVATITRIRRM
jgi:transposase, IS30 family